MEDVTILIMLYVLYDIPRRFVVVIDPYRMFLTTHA